MITIHLYGKYRKLFGAKFKLAVSSFAQAIDLLEANFPGKFFDLVREDAFYIAQGRSLGKHRNIDKVDLLKLNLADANYHLIPKAVGAASGKMGQKGLGALLLGVAILGVSAVFGFAPGIYAGIALMLAGASLLLAPDIAAKEEKKQTNFNSAINVARQGGTRPVIYGRALVGGVMGAGSIDVRDIQE